MINNLKLTIVLLLVATVTFAQKSPRKQTTGKLNEVSISVDYGSPSVKDRVIWGNLVPFDKVWRAGANENTTISFDKDVSINEEMIPAGKYGFFIIPSESGVWEVIFSKKNDAWGSNGYSQDNDQLRVKINVSMVQNSTEKLTYTIDNEGILFSWEKVSLLIPIN